MSTSYPVPKKRGRKPKTLEVKTKIPENLDENVNEKKKRGRKPKSVYSVEISSSINNTCLSDDENVIVRLQADGNANSSDNKDSDDEQPYAYNNDSYNFAACIDDESLYNYNTNTNTNTDSLKIINVLKDFEEKNKNNEWPSNTSICCYWCCHKFDSPPIGIPISYNNNTFNVFGCFCSLECAAAYNFKYNDSIDEVWERYNLINLLSRKLQLDEVIKPAPDKMTLKSFGGFLDIDQFRSYNKTNKIININFQPMVSSISQIEEINEYELNSDLKYIPLDADRISKSKERMQFVRKPVNKSTIESSMNLRSQ